MQFGGELRFGLIVRWPRRTSRGHGVWVLACAGMTNTKLLRVLVGAQDVGPLLDLVLEIFLVERRPRRGRRDHANLVEARTHGWVGERGVERFIELVDRLLRRALGQVHADPGRRLVALEP